MIEIINGFFVKHSQRKDISFLDQKFDYNLLKTAFNVILENDHSLSVAKFIWLYYNNAHLMRITHLHEIISTILDTKFYFLFFHWGWQVRNVFYYFILFTFNHRIRNMDNNNSFTSEAINSARGIIKRRSLSDSPNVTNYLEIVYIIIIFFR